MPAANQPGQRWRGLDAFRGLAVIGMLLVNNPGNHDAVYAQLEHSAWNGCTIADLVFPFFLFVVGITTTISLDAMQRRGNGSTRRTWRRAALIFGIGLLLNWFPFYQSGTVAPLTHVPMVDRIVARLLILRIPGVLQRIAVAYLAGALIARRAGPRSIAIITAALLIGYWGLLTLVPVPGEHAAGFMLLDQPARTITAHVDRGVFDWTRWGLGNHLWDSALTWDPEGLLSTVPSIATVLLGVLCGRWMFRAGAARERRVRGLVMLGIAGVAAIAIGWLWSFAFPLNKSLWTSSFVVFTGGVGAVLLALMCAALDDDARWWASPLLVFGANPLVAYAGSEIARRILHSSIKLRGPDGRMGLDEWVTLHLQSAGMPANAASLAWALLFLAAWWIGLARLSRRQLFVRV